MIGPTPRKVPVSMKRSLLPLTGIAVLCACAPALGAAAIDSGTYKGTTDKGVAVKFKVTSSKQLVHFGFGEFKLKCSDGDTASGAALESGPKKLTITDSGQFVFTVKYKSGLNWLARGTVKGNKASGSIRVKVRFNKTTNKVDPKGSIKCDSGKRKFTATHK
jgi:hypothetical protein